MSVEWIFRDRRADRPEGPPPRYRHWTWTLFFDSLLWLIILWLVVEFVEGGLG